MQTSTPTDKTIYWNIFNSIDFEKIVDHPNILIAAHFWEEEKYQAAKTCYKFMRFIDDLIDNYKSEHTFISSKEKKGLEEDVKEWINSTIQKNKDLDKTAEVIETISKFKIPLWPLEAFSHSMIYDIHHDGFPTLQAFIDYAAGASVAPASIFVHLCGLKKVNGEYFAPAFDIKESSTPCAVFSYLVHIIRDFVKDHTHNLNYFPDDLIKKYDLDREKLLSLANGSDITTGFREMIRELYIVADEYRLKTYAVMQKIKPQLEPRGQLSLEIIFALYMMVFERIDIENGTFTTAELNPTPDEIKEKVREVISSF